jgi:hypothetical protein
MEVYCAAGYRQRANGKELDKLWSSSEIYQKVKQLRAETPRGTAFTVPYNGKQVECKNLAVKLKPITAAARANPTSARCMWLPTTGVNAPAHVPEPPQEPVDEIGSEDDEYWDQLEEIAMETIEAMECREQNAAAAMVSMNCIPGSSRY